MTIGPQTSKLVENVVSATRSHKYFKQRKGTENEYLGVKPQNGQKTQLQLLYVIQTLNSTFEQKQSQNDHLGVKPENCQKTQSQLLEFIKTLNRTFVRKWTQNYNLGVKHQNCQKTHFHLLDLNCSFE